MVQMIFRGNVTDISAKTTGLTTFHRNAFSKRLITFKYYAHSAHQTVIIATASIYHLKYTRLEVSSDFVISNSMPII